MDLVTWIAIGVIVVVAIGLGAEGFFSGLLRGAQILAQNPVVQNATQESTKTAQNTHIATINSETVVQPEKTVYTTTEPVIIVVKNTGSDKIATPNSSDVVKLKNKNSGMTYGAVVRQVKLDVNPGESTDIMWDQRDSAGTTADSGTPSIFKLQTRLLLALRQLPFNADGASVSFYF